MNCHPIVSCNMDQDSLQILPVEQWFDVQETFKFDWPRGISGYTILETQRRWFKEGYHYGFKVYCPFGNRRSGIVAVNEKDTFYEVVIQCPHDDTSKLEEALKITNLIDWDRKQIIIPFAPRHIIECVNRIVDVVNMKVELILPSESFILENRTELFDISLPQSITFGLLAQNNAELIDSTWPHRYPGSIRYFQLLINTKSGFGLFKNEALVSWVFINEAGTLGHMFTLEDHRRKGYAEMVLKLVCNKFFEEDKDVFAFCVKGNVNACKLYTKVGFNNYDAGVAWCYLRQKKD